LNKRERILALTEKAKRIQKLAESENRELTAEEAKEITSLLDETDRLEEEVKLEDRVNKREAWLAEPKEEPIKTDPADSPESRVKIEVGEDRATIEPFRSFGEQLNAIRRCASSHGRDMDKRLLNPESRAATGAGESVPADGGFLVQKDFSDEILRVAHDTGVLASRCRRVPVSGTGLKINAVHETSRADGSRWGGVQAYWTDEAEAMTASKPKFRQIELTLNKLTALFYATDEILEDDSALSAIASQGFGEELAFKIDNAIINGTGAGQPQGIMNANALVSASAASGQSATTFIYDNVVDMWARMYARSRPNSVWLINQDVEPQLFTMSLAVGTGGAPVYLPAGGASVAPYGTLFGRPVIPVEFCQTLGTAGDVILADLSQYILIDKGGVRSDSSIHVRFVNNETVFRYVTRVDGQCWWTSALTPYLSTNTLSPFVVVATRS